jgi:hypothetical protein
MDIEIKRSVELVEADSSGQLPPLRIHHLLFWAAAAAVLLTCQLALIDFYDTHNRTAAARRNSVGLMIQWAIWSIVLSGDLMITFVLAIWASRGYRTQYQPGEWMATFTSVTSIAGLLNNWYTLSLLNSGVGTDWNPSSWKHWPAVGLLLLTAAWIATFAYLALRSSEPRRWRVVYCVLALDGCIDAVISAIGLAEFDRFELTTLERIETISAWSYFTSTSLILAASIVGAVVDYRHELPRRWSHCLGLILLAASSVLAFASAFH